MSWRLLALVILTACGGRERRLTSGGTGVEGQYDVGKPGQGWSRVAPGGADRAWFHGDLGASIYFDSNCKARFEDKPLEDLLSHLTFGMVTAEPLRSEPVQIDGRAALLEVLQGAIDGVNVQVAVVVIKKDQCVYDGLYIASPRGFDAGFDAFKRVLHGFET